MLLTNQGLSNSVSGATVLGSMVVFTLLYTGLGVIWLALLKRYALEGINPKKAPAADETAEAEDADDAAGPGSAGAGAGGSEGAERDGA